MDNRVACVIIASERRRHLVFDRVLPSVIKQDFDEVVCVVDWPERIQLDGVRFLHVSPVQRNTRDALLKRDIGTLATEAETIVYLCDDHTLAPNFLAELREVLDEPWDVVVPNRYTYTPSGPETVFIPLSMGEREGYCAGHAGVFRRYLVEACPWVSFAFGEWEHVRCWDVNSSIEHRKRGALYVFKPRSGIAVEDLEPEAEPWK